MIRPVYLVRHGESTWNRRGLTQGQTDHPELTDLGRQQARRSAALIADDLAGAPVGTIITSDLARAVQSAQLLHERLGGSLRHDARLREQHLGSLQGGEYSEAQRVLRQNDGGAAVLPPGGETRADVQARVTAVLADLDRALVIVLVTHGEVIRIAIAEITGAHPADIRRLEVPNGAVLRLDGPGRLRWLPGSDLEIGDDG